MKASMWKLMVGALVVCWLLGGTVLAQGEPVIADRDKVEIVGTLGGGALSGSLLLSAQADVGELSVLVSDLVDASGAGAPRDPIAAALVTIVPAARWPEVKAGESVQVTLQVAQADAGRAAPAGDPDSAQSAGAQPGGAALGQGGSRARRDGGAHHTVT